ncbi:MAG: insulinase family protein, partial [Muribaculaceae bacterium]|nr:insulinase family protein [Muribaculaceae bacterium]
LSSILKNQESNPQFKMQDNLMRSLYTSPKRQMITSEIIEKAKRENIIEIVRNSMANAADYTFVFVGSIDMDSFRPLLEQYIATLPADAVTASNTAVYSEATEIVKGSGTDTYKIKMETPQTYVFFCLSGNEPYTAKESLLPNIIGQILSKRLIKTVREEMGAVYSIGASGYMSRQGNTNAMIQSLFPMKPEMKQEVLDFIANEIKAMTGNITDDELNAVKEFMVKEATENAELNNPWLNAITGTLINGVDTFNNRVELINSVTVADVQNFLKNLIDQNNYRLVISEPEAE